MNLQSDIIIIYLLLVIASFLLTWSFTDDAFKKRLKSLALRKLGKREPSDEAGAFDDLLIVISKQIRQLSRFPLLNQYLQTLNRELEYSGLSEQFDAGKYCSLHVVYGVFGGLFSSLLLWSLSRLGVIMNLERAICLTLLVALFASFLPYLNLKAMIQKRRRNIMKVLPFTLDLITISVEAGMDFSGAVERIVEKGDWNELNFEFYMYLQEVKLGKRKVEALDRLGKRIHIPVVNSIVTSLIQAEELGMPLGQILRIQATSLRDKRMMLSEKLALEAPTKMLFPLAIFIFPAVFIVLLGPMFIQFVNK